MAFSVGLQEQGRAPPPLGLATARSLWKPIPEAGGSLRRASGLPRIDTPGRNAGSHGMTHTPSSPVSPRDGGAVMRGRAAARWVLAGLYLAAGVTHLALPAPFLLITPGWVPRPDAVILGTGLCEIAGALALPTRGLRRLSGMALALYAVCVVPANIRHAMGGLPGGGLQPGWWYHAPRLALQPVLVWWALFAGEVVDWPFRRRKAS